MTRPVDSQHLSHAERPGWWRRVLLTTLAVAVVGLLTALLAWVVVAASDVLFLAFFGIVFGCFLRTWGEALGRPLGGHPHVGIGVSVVVLLAAIGATGYFLGDRIGAKVQDFVAASEDALDQLDKGLESRPLIRSFVTEVPVFEQILRAEEDPLGRRLPNVLLGNSADSEGTSADSGQSSGQENSDGEEPSGESDGGESENGEKEEGGGEEQPAATSSGEAAGGIGGRLVATAGGFLRTTLGAITSLLVIFFLGLFFAAEPELYRDGAAQLLPEEKRGRFRDLANELAETLWHWVTGQMATMVITGVGVGVAMWLLGVPLPIFLGVFTGLMCFVPNVGAVVAVAIAMLLAVPQGTGTVISVLVVYSLFQALESNVITPLIQKRQVAIPPALLLINQLIFGVLFGFLGIVASTPLLAVVLVVVRRVYVEDIFNLLPDGAEESEATAAPATA